MPTDLEAIRARRARQAAERRRRTRAAALGGLVLLVTAGGVAALSGGGESFGDAVEKVSEGGTLAEAEEPVTITMSFSGDLLIHGPVYQRALALGGGEDYDFAPLFKPIRPYVRRPDLAFCHLEVPMASGPPSSYPIFNAPSALADALPKTGWDACSTASNHTLDQGEGGIADTLAALDDAGIGHAGSATTARAARRPLILEARGVKVAFLAYTSDTNGIPPPSAHAVNIFDRDRIAADARRAKRQGADAVIVNLHWASEVAPEYVTGPSEKQVDFAKDLVKIPEITALVGQGPHVVQPIRRIKGKVVVFSEGNLISNQGADFGLAAASQDGLIALLSLTVDSEGAEITRARFVPTWTDHVDYRVLPVGPALKRDEADGSALRASYERTTDAVGRKAAKPVPAKLP
jgi:poly-gamma-glutamate synthesis protein (capsule biosynthesis protein)